MLRWMAIGFVLTALLSMTSGTTQSYKSSHGLAPDAHSTADSSDPPTIDWFGPPDNSTTEPIICWDGVYSGQTREIWSFEIWVNDTDGVDTVIFRFEWQYEWLNRSTTLIEGNETRGLYAGNLTWGVVWDWTKMLPNPTGGSFSFKVFANDTVGNWVETTEVSYIGGYYAIYTPLRTTPVGTPLGWAAVGVSAIIIAIVVLLILRSRR